jgi:hypothetical protein
MKSPTAIGSWACHLGAVVSVLFCAGASRAESSISASSLTALLQQQPEVFRLLYTLFDLKPASVGTATRIGNQASQRLGGARISPYVFFVNRNSDSRKENDFIVTVKAETVFLDENGAVTIDTNKAMSYHEILKKIEITGNPAVNPPSGRALLADYTTSISSNDYKSSSGLELTTPVGVLIQDRANAHKFGNPDGDTVDEYFISAKRRQEIAKMRLLGDSKAILDEVILQRVDNKLDIKVYLNVDHSKAILVSKPKIWPKTYRESNDWE